MKAPKFRKLIVSLLLLLGLLYENELRRTGRFEPSSIGTAQLIQPGSLSASNYRIIKKETLRVCACTSTPNTHRHTHTHIHQTMASATSARYIELAKALHPRLQRFFAKYPPTQILPSTTRTNTEAATAAAATAGDGGVASTTPPVNPFLPYKHSVTGKWQDPVFSLRRQAELVKLAREQGVEELLPFTTKGTEEQIRQRVEFGLRVRGTGVGQKVKGHLHERMLAAKYVLIVAIFPCSDLTWVRS